MDIESRIHGRISSF